MTSLVSPTEFETLSALRGVLLSVLPEGVPVIRGQANRTPSPKAKDYVVQTPIRRERLETNFDQYVDTRMIGSIAGTTMTITELDYGGLKVGLTILGVGLLANTTVVRQLSGSSGGTGTYQVSKQQSIPSQILAAGILSATQNTKVVVQLDVHGPNGGDNAQRIQTVLHDDYSFLTLERAGSPIRPLYATDPRQVPFINDQKQYEDRWIVEACVQANIAVEIPQEFFETVVIGLIDVDAKYKA